MQIQGYNLPDDLYYEEHHYWVKAEGDLLVMGMNDFAQKLAGEVVFVQLPFEGFMAFPAPGSCSLQELSEKK